MKLYPKIKPNEIKMTWDLVYEEEKQYKKYIDEHRQNVAEFWNLLHPKCIGDFRMNDYFLPTIDNLIRDHDVSKYSGDEFNGYRQYFYPRGSSPKSKERFYIAWNHHQNANPHHWEYWVMAEGDVLEMPLEYIIEMLCDWGAMSMKFNNKISAWYNKNKSEMKLHNSTIECVEKWLPIADSCLED